MLGLIGSQQDRAEPGQLGRGAVHSGATGVGVIGEEDGAGLAGKTDGERKGAAGMGVDDGVGFSGEQSLEIGPGPPGGQQEAEGRRGFVQRVRGIAAGQLGFPRLKEGGVDPEDVFPLGGVAGRGNSAQRGEDAAVVLGSPHQVEDPVRFGRRGHTVEGRGMRAVVGRR